MHRSRQTDSPLRSTPQIPALRALVFDFDGTLALLTLDFEDMRSRLDTLARDFSSELPSSHGRPILEWQALVAQKLDNGTASDAKKAKTFLNRSADLILSMEVEAAREGMLFAFTRPLLISLRRAGIKSAIITRNCSEAVTSVFPDYAEFCSALLTRDDVVRAKPEPEHLLTALERIGCVPQEAMMVGDHPMDVLTGKRAGAWTAGVASGRVSQRELLESGADMSAADCDELVRELRMKGIIPHHPD